MKVALVHRGIQKHRLSNFADGIKRFGHKAELVHRDSIADIESADWVVSFGNVIFNHFNKPWIHLDEGFLRRGEYFRVSLNAHQAGLYMQNISRPSDRWDRLRVVLLPWTNSTLTDKIIVCTSSIRNHRFLKTKLTKEIKYAKKALAEHAPNREVLFRLKGIQDTRPLYLDLPNTHALVSWSSNAAVEAVVSGIPAFTLGNSAALPVSGTDLTKIESPIRPDRTQWAYNLAYQQFTLEEFKKGIPWAQLVEDGILGI